MVRRHSFNRRARQDLRESIEGQGEGTNVKSKVYDLVPSFHLVYHGTPPSCLEATTGSGFGCHYMKNSGFWRVGPSACSTLGSWIYFDKLNIGKGTLNGLD
ncbi:uncharacterized protein OCT59_011348 [Rhizophagus irregularis]|uniref:uncharacterized protein n=1 Tax=Rhizophagus irregularis TaxID=588596 RepID=UPI0033192BAA|nr:hypothetical protein OCT59_011348 [Rhizophagus irregularis]